MVQPAQWMRYYSARSCATLRRSAMIFAIVLTICYIFGVMLVGLAGQALYPIAEDGKYRVETVSKDNPGQTAVALVNPDEAEINWGKILPHPKVGKLPGEFDQVMIVTLKDNLPKMLGTFGLLLVALILTAVIAAAMSTADSNLHALSGLLTRDVYDRFINPGAGDRAKTWVGRGVIAATTIISLILVIASRHSARFNPIAMLVPLLFLAVAFSSQLLPVTIDMLFIKRGSRAGAIAGMMTGIVVVFLFSPFWSVFTEAMGIDNVLRNIERIVDISACGFVCNVIVFALVSMITKRPDVVRVKEFTALMESEKN
jgi:Na+/proline symporter